MCRWVIVVLAFLFFAFRLNAVDEAFNEKSSAGFATLSWMNSAAMIQITRELSDRSAFLYDFGYEDCCYSRGNLWVDGLLEDLSQKKLEKLPAFHSNTNAIMFGQDFHIGSSLLVGGTAGYAQTHFKWKQYEGKGKIKSTYLGAYGGFYHDCYRIDTSVLVGFNRYEVFRYIEDEDCDDSSFKDSNLNSSRDLHAFSRHSGVSYDIHLGGEYDFVWCEYILIPFATVDYVAVNEEKFYESKGEEFNLDIHRHYASGLRTEVGLGVSNGYCFDGGILVSKAKLSWVAYKPISGRRERANFRCYSDSFTIDTTEKPINSVAPGLNFLLKFDDCISIVVDYEGEFGFERLENLLSLVVDWRF